MFTLFLHYMTSSIITLSWFSWCPALSCSWSRTAWSKESNRALVSYVIVDRGWVSGILSSTTECFPMCELYFTNHYQKTFFKRLKFITVPHVCFVLVFTNSSNTNTYRIRKVSHEPLCQRAYASFGNIKSQFVFWLKGAFPCSFYLYSSYLVTYHVFHGPLQ
jgi:hypothetical protein